METTGVLSHRVAPRIASFTCESMGIGVQGTVCELDIPPSSNWHYLRGQVFHYKVDLVVAGMRHYSFRLGFSMLSSLDYGVRQEPMYVSGDFCHLSPHRPGVVLENIIVAYDIFRTAPQEFERGVNICIGHYTMNPPRFVQPQGPTGEI